MRDFFKSVLEAFLEILIDILELLSGREKRFNRRDFQGQGQTPSTTQGGTPVEMGIESDEAPKYKKNKSVLTYRERILLRAIRRATEDEFTILMKVRMGDFIWLSNEPKDKNSTAIKSNVSMLIFYFVENSYLNRFW